MLSYCVRISNTIWNNWYDNIYPCLLSTSKDVNLTFHTMYDVCSSFWQVIIIIYIKLAVSISHFLRGFYKSKECLIFKKLFIYFNWRIITLQYCDGFCHISTWVSHRLTCVPSLLNPLPPLSPLQPSRLSQSTAYFYQMAFLY